MRFVQQNKGYERRRAMWEGFCFGFLSQLNENSVKSIVSLIREKLVPELTDQQLFGPPPKALSENVVLCPPPTSKSRVGYYIETGTERLEIPTDFVVTPSVRENLHLLARAALWRRCPVLLEGPTSSGKTSMVMYLAKLTGHRCVRINNHEHTDLQEYLGSYKSDTTGRFVFVEGPLVTAARRGDWVVLDELNLAPSEVLEALNRLLDDNREILIPETNGPYVNRIQSAPIDSSHQG